MNSAQVQAAGRSKGQDYTQQEKHIEPSYVGVPGFSFLK